jgi:hypothetical protein
LPVRSARYCRIAPDSKITIGSPSSVSASTMAGILLLGLIASYSGVNWSPLLMFTGIRRYGSPHSSSMIVIFLPLPVGQK